jgi:hypothetical protein
MKAKPWVAAVQLLAYSIGAWLLTLAFAWLWALIGLREFDADTIGLSAFFVAIPVLAIAAIAVLKDLKDPALRFLPEGSRGLSLFLVTVIPGFELFLIGGLIGT